MKKIKWFAAIGLFISIAGGAQADEYDDYLRKLQGQMEEAGTQVDVFDKNPFQSGTPLSQYYLNERTLLLSRDAFFSLKANKLETTEDVADYQFRAKVLRSHANNMMIQMIDAIKQRNDEGFTKLEPKKQKADYEKLISDCNKDPKCVSDQLQNPETSITNILVDNFTLATQVFKQIPYLQSLELHSVYQMIQLSYIEVLNAQNKLSAVEFDLFLKKQKTLSEALRANMVIMPWERDFQINLIQNLVSQWKKRILQRKVDHTAEYETLAKDLTRANQKLLDELYELQAENPNISKIDWEILPCTFRKWVGKEKHCWISKKIAFEPLGRCARVAPVEDWPQLFACINPTQKNEKVMEPMIRMISEVRKGQPHFLGSKEAKLPSEFWEKL